MGGHPCLEAGVTGMLLRGRPDPRPVRAAISAEADQVQGFRALVELRRQLVLEQHDRRPVPAGKPGPDMPGRLGDAGCRAGLGDHGQVARLRADSQPHAQMPNVFPARACRRIPPERFIGDQFPELRQVIHGGGRQAINYSVLTL